jgi:hypothetical protein
MSFRCWNIWVIANATACVPSERLSPKVLFTGCDVWHSLSVGWWQCILLCCPLGAVVCYHRASLQHIFYVGYLGYISEGVHEFLYAFWGSGHYWKWKYIPLAWQPIHWCIPPPVLPTKYGHVTVAQIIFYLVRHLHSVPNFVLALRKPIRQISTWIPFGQSSNSAQKIHARQWSSLQHLMKGTTVLVRAVVHEMQQARRKECVTAL